jgi:hypothetical protein
MARWCVLVLVGFVAVSAAQEKKKLPAPKPPAFLRMLRELPQLDDTSRYLVRVAKLREIVKKPDAAGLNQLLAAEEAFLGRYKQAMALMDLGRPEVPAAKNTDALDDYQPKDAAEAVLALAEKHQVVIVNEGHHVPRHRAFATLLLKALRKKGFTYFAAETFAGTAAGKGDDDMAPMAKRGYPTLTDGYYSNEPYFGDLVRTALKLGFTPVAYEHRWATAPASPTTRKGQLEQIEQREEGQAQNLVQRIFKKAPKAKVVVFVGYSHANKAPVGKQHPVEWMAARLKKATGIDPLTVDQAQVMEHSRPAFEHPAYRLALQKKKTTTRPWVLYDARKAAYYVPPRDHGGFDLTVFHPRDEYEQGRPTWARMGGYRKPAKPAGLPDVPEGGSLLLQAFRKGEDAKVAVPVDQIEYTRDDPAPVVLLPVGEYAVRVVDAVGKVRHEAALAVE